MPVAALSVRIVSICLSQIINSTSSCNSHVFIASSLLPSDLSYFSPHFSLRNFCRFVANIEKKHSKSPHFCPIHSVIVICLVKTHCHIFKNPPEGICAKYLFLKNVNVSSMLLRSITLLPVTICIYPH